MRIFLAACLSLLLSNPVFAEQKYSSGDLDIHYIVFNSSFLQPNVAKASGLERSKNVAILNVSLVRNGQGEKADVQGNMTNLLGQTRTLSFKEIDEGNAVYYIAQFPIDGREMLRFALNITDAENTRHTINFSQEVFPDP